MSKNDTWEQTGILEACHEITSLSKRSVKIAASKVFFENCHNQQNSLVVKEYRRRNSISNRNRQACAHKANRTAKRSGEKLIGKISRYLNTRFESDGERRIGQLIEKLNNSNQNTGWT